LASIRSLSSRKSVIEAIEEFDRLGRDDFFQTYEYGPSRSYLLEYRRRKYDSKAIAGVAWGLQHFDDGKRRPDNYTGGKYSSVLALEELDFKVVQGRGGPARTRTAAPLLRAGAEYTAEQVARKFRFAPGLLNRAGGMISRPDVGALLLISNPRKGGAIYGDKWELNGKELIYAGKGLTGDQQLSGENRMVAENSRELYLFESPIPGRLLFHGKVRCVDSWTSRDPDKEGNDRRVYRFRLRLDGQRAKRTQRQLKATKTDYKQRDPTAFKRRPFDPQRKATKRRRSVPSNPENRDALNEQADTAHQATLKRFGLWLKSEDWVNLDEIDGATDLVANQPARTGGRQTLFEIKSVRSGTERSRVRGGLAQLLEYRLRFGDPDDLLCLVTSRTIPYPQQQLLDSVGIGHAYVDRGRIRISGTQSSRAIFPNIG
jgi:5-methylcytosine-specific restriction protein A